MSIRPLLTLSAVAILGFAALAAAPAAAQGFGVTSSGPINANQAGTIPNGPYLTNMPTLPGGPSAGQFTTQGAPVTTMASPGAHPAVINRGFGPFGRSGMQNRPQGANSGANPTANPAAGLRPQNSWAFRRAR